MLRYLLSASFTMMVLSAGWLVTGTRAQTAEDTAEAHVAKARAAAYRPGHDATWVFKSVCKQPTATEIAAEPRLAPYVEEKIPPRSQWFAEPAKVFDNLYFIGSTVDSSWAVTTSAGIIVVDTGQAFSAKELITGGLMKLGLDPTQIKYVVLSHAHGDRYHGAKYLQETYHARVIMSEADWNVVAKSDEPADEKPAKDMIATDGMKLTLGDTTLRLYITPGHTPGTISTLIPLKDGNQKHMGEIFGGLAEDYGRYGVQYFPDNITAIRAWEASARRWMEITKNAHADVYLSIHPPHDKLLDRVNALKFRGPGDPHPFVDANAVQNHLIVIAECMDAQLAWRNKTLTSDLQQ